MRTARQRILFKSILTTAVAAIGALLVFALIRMDGGDPITVRDWWETSLIPVVVGFPIAAYIFRQGEMLRESHERLVVLNAETEEAHRLLKEAHAAIAFAATHDGLTGQLSREQFLDILAQEQLTPRPSVLLIVDVDRFKSINDNYGHLLGDEALISIAQVIKGSVRERDEVGRIGGDEFGVLLRDVHEDAARELAESIRFRVGNSPIDLSDGRRIDLSVSIGAASMMDFRGSVRDVVGYADLRLYEAKRSGRNRVAMRPHTFPRPLRATPQIVAG